LEQETIKKKAHQHPFFTPLIVDFYHQRNSDGRLEKDYCRSSLLAGIHQHENNNMSWFATGLDTLNALTEKVQQAIPDVVDKDLLAKLTLNTDEMKAERQQFGEEAKRKAEAKNLLAGMFPWETRDSELEILVEECKEAILALSSKEETFYGPYEMPSLKVNLDAQDGNKEDGDDEDDDDEDETQMKNSGKPSAESLEKLAKLQPLPPLLRDFDLDCHVGLIQKLILEDPTLKQQQSILSGGGEREKVFWQNYFFHSAYTRYEAGLSIDEIWSFKVKDAASAAQESAAAAQQQAEEDGDVQEETVDFDSTDANQGTPKPAFAPDEVNSGSTSNTATSVAGSGSGETGPNSSVGSSPPTSAVSEFELLDSVDADAVTGDPELDELEAEIARELED